MSARDDQQFMARALELATRGVNTTTPNPRVGCVIVRDGEAHKGKIIAEGWHQRAGEPHAEIIALRQAGANAAGATVYVTLEPCCTAGRTGPCTEALIEAGVSRVVYAMQDPNPDVNGRGSEKLQAAGIAVTGDVCVNEAMALNRGFTKRMTSGLPWVMAKTASSLDGRSAMASGESKWITGPEARQQVQGMRAASCAIVTGVGTLLEDDPAFTVREEQAGFAVQRQPALIIMDANLRTPVSAKVFSDALSRQRRIICAYTQADQQARSALEAVGAECWQIIDESQNIGRVSIVALLKRLGDEAFNDVMLETGPTLLGSFMQSGCIDELQAFVSPKLMGSTARPVVDMALEHLSEAQAFDLIGVAQYGNDLLLRLQPTVAPSRTEG